MYVIQFSTRVFTGITGQTRNRLRKTRILNRLRAIKRQHPTLVFTVQRGVNYITVEFANQLDFTMFALMWPINHPSWQEVTNDIS